MKLSYILNSFSILSAIILAIANEDVAPGDGAFLQCNTLLPIAPELGLESNTKSSISVPGKKNIFFFKKSMENLKTKTFYHYTIKKKV